jgi:RNA 2',3'-cyclic 3'-phosphodiesterase
MRLFFGATLPERTKMEIVRAQEILGPLIPSARFEGIDKLHITLLFVGDFPENEAPRLFESAEEELKKHPAKSPSTEIVGVDFFPNERVRRGVWLACEDDGSLAAFADALKVAARRFGVVPEARIFKSHITIARFRETIDRQRETSGNRGHPRGGDVQGVGDLQKLMGKGKLSFERFFPKSVALFESTLKPSGSKYRILHEYSLE